jgi:hypothetical protein
VTNDQRATCPVCGTGVGEPFIRIPDMPVHCNVLWTSAEEAQAAPRGDLDLVFCTTCGHVHNAAFDPERTTYGATYENSLHHSAVFQEYASALVDDLVERHDLRDVDVVEIGAGQGDFLEMLCAAGENRGAGFDPSFVDAAAPSARVRLVADFYGEQYADHPADVIVCRHVLEHIDRSGDFVHMVRRVIGTRPVRLVLFEVPDAAWTLSRGGIWDLIYEHCGYFTEASLRYAFTRSGFRVERIDTVFGDQFIVLEATPAAEAGTLPADHVTKVEALAGDVAAFAAAHAASVGHWRGWFDDLARDGRSAVVWGAGSKGVTFLNTVDRSRVTDRAVDINPRKRGMHISGTGQRIVAPEELCDDPPDAVIVMNPNYRDEVAATLSRLGLHPEIVVATS